MGNKPLNVEYIILCRNNYI